MLLLVVPRQQQIGVEFEIMRPDPSLDRQLCSGILHQQLQDHCRTRCTATAQANSNSAGLLWASLLAFLYEPRVLIEPTDIASLMSTIKFSCPSIRRLYIRAAQAARFESAAFWKCVLTAFRSFPVIFVGCLNLNHLDHLPFLSQTVCLGIERAMAPRGSANAKKPRASKPKVKTGCLTCKYVTI